MKPLDEARSLREYPLPEIIAPDDKLLPSRIALIDLEVSRLEERLADLRSSRVLLLDHAIKIGVMEDEQYKIVTKIIRGDRIASAEELKVKDLILWNVYIQMYTENARRAADALLQKAKDNEMSKVILGIADSVFGKSVVTACSEVPEKKEYEIVRKV